MTPTIYHRALSATPVSQQPETPTDRVRATWVSGDFGRIAKGYRRGAAEFIGRLGFARGEPTLDVGCGTGNISLPAARIGATVTGIDIAPNLVVQARTRAAAEGLKIRFDVGDAQRLPYENGSFRTVVTMFGAMFAPRPERAAAELLRVTAPGGRIAMANWTPGGFIGQMLHATATYATASSGDPSPLVWGVEDAVRERLGHGVASFTFARRIVAFEYPMSPEEVAMYFRLWYGPVVRAFAALDERGRQSLRRELEELWRDNNRAKDGTTRVQSEYLEVHAVMK